MKKLKNLFCKHSVMTVLESKIISNNLVEVKSRCDKCGKVIQTYQDNTFGMFDKQKGMM